MDSTPKELEHDRKLSRGCGRVLAVVLLVPAAIMLLAIVFWVGWGTPVGPLGPVLAYPFFTHPPPSTDNPPLVKDARNVGVERRSKPDGRTVTYETGLSRDEVYLFYKEALTRDGWGEKRYYGKPTPVMDALLLEWDQFGPNGCEELGYTFWVEATAVTSDTTRVRLEIAQINPC
ncbi:MAG: hypothetical protein ACJ78Q_01880 [Chloroflexia bacterium]